MLSRKMPENLNMKKIRDRKLSLIIKNMYIEIKDLSTRKLDACSQLLKLLNKELEITQTKVKKRENYFYKNNIRPEKALEYFECGQISKDFPESARNSTDRLCSHKKETKGKQGVDVQS